MSNKFYYTIECEPFGGTGEKFTTIWDARHHASFWTDKEKKGCYIVQYLKKTDEAIKTIELDPPSLHSHRP